MASSDAKPVPQKNVAYRITFPILDADGDLVTGATGLDSEVSKDGGTFADCTNEATEIATSSGVYYLDLTSTEMNADTVAVIIKTSTSGAKTTTVVLYPEEAGDIRVNVTAFGGTAGTFASGRPEVNTTHAAGTAWGSGAITAASIAADAITAAKIADGAIDANTFAAGAITAAAIAADAITDAKVASDVTIASVTGAVGSVTGNVGGNVTGSVGSISGVTFPTNFSALGINASGHVSRVVLCDTITTYTGNTVQTGDSYARIGATGSGLTSLASAANLATVAGYLDTEIASIISTLGAAGAGLTAVPWNAAWDAEVQSEVQDAIEANNLDHLVKVAVDTNFATTVHLDSVIGHLADAGTTATFDRTTDALEVIGGTVATNLDATVSSRAAATGVNVTAVAGNTNTPDFLAAMVGDGELIAELTGSVSGGVGGDVAGKVLGTASGGGSITGIGVRAEGAGGAAVSTLDAAGVRTAVGLASANLDTQLTAIDDYLDTEIAAIKAKTDQLTFTVAGQVDANAESINGTAVVGAGTSGNKWRA